MEERDHYLAKQYHRQLVEIAAEERRVSGVSEHSPSRLYPLLDWCGDRLISLGQRLKTQGSMPELSEDCA